MQPNTGAAPEPIETVAGESQAQRAYRAIEQMIVTLDLPPGSRVSEQSMSETLRIGRTPVREAMQRLAHEGTIHILPRSGAVVLDIDVEDHFKLIEVRREVERVVMGRAARMADVGARMMFAELRTRFERAVASDDEAVFISADREFNALVARSADNVYAANVMGPLQAQTRRFWYLHFKEFGDLAKVCGLHAAICDAIAGGDEPAARTASDRLIDYVVEYTYATMRALNDD